MVFQDFYTVLKIPTNPATGFCSILGKKPVLPQTGQRLFKTDASALAISTTACTQRQVFQT
jgi:hypothetical protein